LSVEEVAARAADLFVERICELRAADSVAI